MTRAERARRRGPSPVSVLLALALPALVWLGGAEAAAAEPVHGHIKAEQQFLSAAADSVDAALGDRRSRETSLDLRLSGRLTAGRFAFDADYLLQAEAGNAVEFRRALEALEPALFVDRTTTNWLPLDGTLRDDGRMLARHSLDRFAATLTTDRWVLRLGRQAHSWGNGIVFRPFDIFDPFAPDVLDDSYKPGIDALYAQRLFDDGSDLAVLVVPRREPVTGRLASSSSSAAVRFRRVGEKLQIDWLVARDYRDRLAGLGVSGSVGDAVWRLDVVPVWLDGGGTRTSVVANLEHAWQWRGKNVSGFVEYFRNGFGRSDRAYALDALAPVLVDRIARGQVFDTGRNYLAGGLRLELTPLVEIDPVLLVNLDDESTLLLLRGSYSVAQNLAVDFGLRAAGGGSGTEFGGLPTSAGSGVFYAPATRVYARLAHYF